MERKREEEKLQSWYFKGGEREKGERRGGKGERGIGKGGGAKLGYVHGVFNVL